MTFNAAAQRLEKQVVVPQQNSMQQGAPHEMSFASDAPPLEAATVGEPSNPPVFKQGFPSVILTWPGPSKDQDPPPMAAVGVDFAVMSAVIPLPVKLHPRLTFVAFCTLMPATEVAARRESKIERKGEKGGQPC